MSLTARERHNPPPRRKSCAACIKAKRRCDAAMPACFRCSQRRITCDYPRAIGRQPRTATPQLGLRQDDVLSDEDSLGGSHVSRHSQLAEGSVRSDMDVMDTGFPELSLFGLCADETPSELTHQPDMLMPPSYRDLAFSSELTEKRLKYSVELIKKAPSMMVLDTQTPWCHPLLYRDAMPRSMQDAHASCALYMAKTRANSPVIFRSIESRVNDLLDAPTPVTPMESLAHTQALILYQIIRLFDGDIGARASAERTIPSLETSALCLLTHIQFHTDAAAELPLYPLATTKSFWKDWIFQETARRTILLTFYFLQAYRLLRGDVGLACDGKLGLVHSWTVSGHLWHAGTPVEFAEVWRKRKHYVVTNSMFMQVLDEAQADDIDWFGKMMISSLLGIDEAEGWFCSRGGSLYKDSLGNALVC